MSDTHSEQAVDLPWFAALNSLTSTVCWLQSSPALERQTVARRDGCSGPEGRIHSGPMMINIHHHSWLKYIGNTSTLLIQARVPLVFLPHNENVSTSIHPRYQAGSQKSVENTSHFGSTSRSAIAECKRRQGSHWIQRLLLTISLPATLPVGSHVGIWWYLLIVW